MTERSLTYRILTVAETAALEATSAALEDLARAGTDAQPGLDDAGQALDDLSRSAGDAQPGLERARTGLQDLDQVTDTARQGLDDVSRAADDVDLDQVGTAAHDAATKVDDGFDAMAKSASDGSTKVRGEAREMRQSLRSVSDEAGDTAREAAASFSSTGDIGDALQEVAANAPATLGPLGLAFGAVAGIGVGLFRARTEALKERVSELVDAMIDAGGRLSKEFVDAQVLQLVKDGEAQRLEELVKLYKITGVTVRDVIRARAGDEDAIEKVTKALDTETKRRKTNADELGKSEAAVAALTDGIGQGADALRLAKEATEDYGNATVDNSQTVKTATATARGAWDDLRGSMIDPITGEVRVRKPSAGELAGVRGDIADGIGPIIVDVVARPRSTALFYPGSRSIP